MTVPTPPPVRDAGMERPHPSRLAPDHPRFDEIVTLHAAAVADGRPWYRDPDTGLDVMTAPNLVASGGCCDTGCRHCPWVGGADKTAWRRWARQRRSGLDLAAVSAAVVELVAPVVERVAGDGRRVLLYRALPDEVDLDTLLHRFGAAHFAVTRTPTSGPLTVHGAEAPTEQHRFGFAQPVAEAPVVAPGDVAVALVPGLAFDTRGGRLGFGAGYYDRLLPTLDATVPRIGVAPAALVVPEVPTEPHDVAMTHIVTERAIAPTRRPGQRRGGRSTRRSGGIA